MNVTLELSFSKKLAVTPFSAIRETSCHFLGGIVGSSVPILSILYVLVAVLGTSRKVGLYFSSCQ